MGAERYQANIPFVGPDGRTTMVSQQFLEKLVREVSSLRADTTDLQGGSAQLQPGPGFRVVGNEIRYDISSLTRG